MNIELYLDKDIKPLIDEVALLRIKVFREYPYLYDGSLDVEENYLKVFLQAGSSALFVARDGKKIIGIALGISLKFANDKVKTSFLQKKINLESIYLLSDLIVLKEYRKKGIGLKLLHSFEKYVAEKPKFTKIAFYQIARPSDDPRKPKDYTSLDSFWTKQGYAKHPEHTFTLSWKEIGDRQETIEPMVYWIKDHSNPSQA